ncbi:MAG: sugar phosphate isomerase/epimerase family protein [Planctomycetota bacterium]|jgi:sugar phosphate isomerase/epimerase
MLFYISLETYRRELTLARQPLTLRNVADHIASRHQLRGMVVPTEFLKGSEVADLDTFRADNDKGGCPALALQEISGLRLASRDKSVASSAMDRLERVLIAAQRLGCGSVGFSIESADTDEYFDLSVERLKQCATRAERLELNLLLKPHRGITEKPERVVEIIKRVGGFRLGVLPDFADATLTSDPFAYMKMLAPYAPIVLASTGDFDAKGKHTSYDLAPLCDALKIIGYNAGICVVYRGEGDTDEGVEYSGKVLADQLIEEDP